MDNPGPPSPTDLSRIAAALRQCQEGFSFLLESAKEYALLTLDPQGIVQTWNLGAQRLSGYSAAEIVGESCSRLFQGKDVEHGNPLLALKEAAARGSAEIEGWLVRRDGSRLWVCIETKAWHDEGGVLRGFRQVVRDLTERKKTQDALAASEERFRLLVTSVRDYAILMLDPEGHILSWNAGAERIKGYRSHEIIGQHFSRFYPREDVARGKPEMELRVASEVGRFEDEGWRVRRDGSRFWANVIITALRDEEGQLRGFAKVTRDYTQRKQAEEQLRQSEERLRQSEERFRLMVDSVKDYAIFMLDPQGRITSWNSGAERIKQYRAEEILGRHFSCFYPPEDVARHKPEKMLEAAVAEGRVEDEGWRVRKDGSRFWADVVITALRGKSGELLGFVKVTRDFTDRRRAEQALRETEERFRLIVSQVKDYAIFMLDPQGRVATWSAGAEAAEGYKAEEIIGQHFSRFYSQEDVEAGKPEKELQIAREQGRVEDEGWRIRKDGSRFWANVVITALYADDGTLRGFAKVTRDITARKHEEESRAQLTAALESIHAREEVLSIASHELKTPITSLQLHIQNLAAALERGDPGALQPQALRQKLDAANRQVQRLTNLVYTLLDVSRITTGRLHLERQNVDLSRLVRDACDRFSREAERAGCRLSVEAPADVNGCWDPSRLEQVLNHLLANAVKYGPGSPVEIEVERTERVARVRVRDHGIGISHEDKARLFERFERLLSIRHYGGFGLGLWLSRVIVEAHGGVIWADSEPGKGSTFTIELPWEGLPSPPAGPAPTVDGEAS